MNLKRIALLAVLATSSISMAGDVAETWKKHCKSCHGEDGKGKTKTGAKEKIDDMSTEKWQTKWTDEKIKTLIVDGKKDTKMKSFKAKLTDEDVEELIKHIRTFKG